MPKHRESYKFARPAPNEKRRKKVCKKFRGSKEEGKDKHTVTPKTVTHPKFTKKVSKLTEGSGPCPHVVERNNNIKKTRNETPHCKPLRSNRYVLCTINPEMILSDQPGYRSTFARGLTGVSGFLPLVEKKIGLRFGDDLWGDLFCSVIIKMIPFVLIFHISVIMARVCSVY